jgi:hypothetical protein
MAAKLQVLIGLVNSRLHTKFEMYTLSGSWDIIGHEKKTRHVLMGIIFLVFT